MTDPAPDAELRALLIRLVTDGAHHNRCAALARHEESRLAHDGFAAAFHIAALYTADILATGTIRCRSAHRVHPKDRAAAERLAGHLPSSPATRARLIGEAVRANTEAGRD